MTNSVLTDDCPDRIAQEQQVALSLLQEAPSLEALLTWTCEKVLQEGTPLLRPLARVYGVPPDSDEDVAQEVLLEIVERLPELTGANQPPLFGAWLCCVMQSKAVDAHRRAKRHRADDLGMVMAAGREPADAQPGPVQALEQQELEQRLHAALEELRQQAGDLNARVLELRFLEKQTLMQVAATLGLSVKSVSKRQRCALAKLRAILKL